jgi:Protein of unknown function (DUF1553)/Protein of unknown function (DUF1549)/Planctomycete cytochrome C
MLQHNRKFLLLYVLALLTQSPKHASAGEHATGDDFFEKKVRPLLVKRCGKCHGDSKPRGGLRLTSRLNVLRGGDSGPAAVVGKPEESLFLRAVRQEDDNLKMPPSGKLSDNEIEVLTTWVRQGMPWPEEKSRLASPPGQQPLWSLQPVRNFALPPVKDAAWPRSPIDRFILAKLEEQGLAPARPADKQTLLRRVTFDLIGLPPTPEEIEAFLEDHSADAFAKVVDRLLASPHYGEHWGRHWLDLIHYADGQVSSDFPEIWLYRDWVTKAFNRDLPYTDFLTLQIAGDLLSVRDRANMGVEEPDALVATGMLAITQFNGSNLDPKLMNAEYVDDQVDVVSRAFLGLTIACARCHNHKFDPISTEDYYALAGIFFNTRAIERLGEMSGTAPSRIRAPLVPETVKLRQRRQGELQSALRAWPAWSARLVVSLGAPSSAGPLLTVSALHPILTPPAATLRRERRAALRQEIEELRKQPSPDIPQAVVVEEGGHAQNGFEKFKDAPVYLRGNPENPGKVVPRGFPRALGGARRDSITQGSGRLELARWLTSLDHPLTARVMVNRLWQHHFGEGIVRTSSNFGELGERPTHPELLDYLAARFVQSGWSLKAIHRLLLLSATYQQSSTISPEDFRKDPDNRLWGRMNRLRLQAEAIRDSLLAIAGRLRLTLGGPGFQDLSDPRRTYYLKMIRDERYNPNSPVFSLIFDRPDPSLVSEKRVVSTIAPQALFMLNDPFVAEQAKALANRLAHTMVGKSPEEKIRKLYLLCLGRLPTNIEIDVGRRFLAQTTIADPWIRYCQAIFCTNEFVYVD